MDQEWTPIIDAEIRHLRAQADIVCECGETYLGVYISEPRPFGCPECGRSYRIIAVIECNDSVPRQAAADLFAGSFDDETPEHDSPY